MKAVICTKYGNPEVLKITKIPKPIPKKNEVLIKIMSTAVNSADVRIRGLKVNDLLKIMMKLIVGFSKPRNPVLGNVLSGIVEKTGDSVKNFKAGDECFAITGFKLGTYAEYITLNEDAAISLKPKNATFEESTAIIFGGTTALHFLEKSDIKNMHGKNVMIYGASGSVGTSAVQIAKYHGAKVMAVCSKNNIDLVKSLGADEVVDYTASDFRNIEKKFQIIFDAVGKLKKSDVRNLLEKHGKFITVGGLEVASETSEQLATLKKMFETNDLKPVIDRIYYLDEIQKAHQYVDTERKRGNVVVKVSD